MRVLNKKYNFLLELQENKVEVIVCENRAEYFSLIDNLRLYNDDDTSQWIFSDDNGTKVKSSDVDIIYSPLCFELNSKKIINKIYSDLECIIINEFFESKQEINSKIITLIDNAMNKIDYNLEYKYDIDVKEILKSYHVALEENHIDLLDKLTEYAKMASRVLGIKCICLINFKDYLTDKDLGEFYKECFYQKVNLILLESQQRSILPFENYTIIDADNCIIRV